MAEAVKLFSNLKDGVNFCKFRLLNFDDEITILGDKNEKELVLPGKMIGFENSVPFTRLIGNEISCVIEKTEQSYEFWTDDLFLICSYPIVDAFVDNFQHIFSRINSRITTFGPPMRICSNSSDPSILNFENVVFSPNKNIFRRSEFIFNPSEKITLFILRPELRSLDGKIIVLNCNSSVWRVDYEVPKSDYVPISSWNDLNDNVLNANLAKLIEAEMPHKRHRAEAVVARAAIIKVPEKRILSLRDVVLRYESLETKEFFEALPDAKFADFEAFERAIQTVEKGAKLAIQAGFEAPDLDPINKTQIHKLYISGLYDVVEMPLVRAPRLSSWHARAEWKDLRCLACNENSDRFDEYLCHRCKSIYELRWNPFANTKEIFELPFRSAFTPGNTLDHGTFNMLLHKHKFFESHGMIVHPAAVPRHGTDVDKIKLEPDVTNLVPVLFPGNKVSRNHYVLFRINDSLNVFDVFDSTKRFADSVLEKCEPDLELLDAAQILFGRTNYRTYGFGPQTLNSCGFWVLSQISKFLNSPRENLKNREIILDLFYDYLTYKKYLELPSPKGDFYEEYAKNFDFYHIKRPKILKLISERTHEREI